MPALRMLWKTRTSWRAKLHKPAQPKLVPISDGMAKRFGPGMMLIPTALQLDSMIRKVPRGHVATLTEIRSRLARWHRVDVTCPLVTGIFLRIVAEAAEEDRRSGRPDITPYWRIVGPGGRLNPKFPGGQEEHARRLREEGHIIKNGRVVTAAPAAPAA